MAASIEETLSLRPELIAGSGGVFDVVADGKLIFSKKSAGRFPTEDEVLNQLSAMKQ